MTVATTAKRCIRRASLLRSGQLDIGQCAATEQDYLLVVTSRELVIGGGEMLQRLFAPGGFDCLDEQARERMPHSHVFILSIEDFESLALRSQFLNFSLAAFAVIVLG